MSRWAWGTVLRPPHGLSEINAAAGRHELCYACRQQQIFAWRAMTLLVWLILGVAIGYLGHLILSADPDRGCFMNVLVGALGALWVIRLMDAHMSAAASQGAFGIQTGVVCLVSLLVAVVLVGVANLLRRGRLR